jgi:hypothetical protein
MQLAHGKRLADRHNAMGQTRRFVLLERLDYSKSRRRRSQFSSSLRAYDNGDLRKLREGQQDKNSITAIERGRRDLSDSGYVVQ